MWFSKSKKNKKPTVNTIDNVIFDLEPSLEAHRRGIIYLATEYYLMLPKEEIYKFLDMYKKVTGVSPEGQSITEATSNLTAEQLLRLQRLIEAEYNFTKH